MLDSTDHIGSRIKEFRVIRDLSLAELGRRAHVSTSHLSRIENGDRYVSPAVVSAVARVLGVSVSVLHGQPYVQQLQADRLDAMLSPLSTALDMWDIPLDDEPLPRPLPALEAEMTRIVGQRLKTEFSAIAQVLPGLIAEVAHAAQLHDRPGHDRERAYTLQAEAARTAAIIAYRTGYMDLARLALARMAAAAPQSGDPRQVAVERYERAQITHAVNSRPDRGVALVRTALRDLDDDDEAATQAVRGTLQLRAASLALRQGDGNASADWLGQAAELAAQTGETRNYAMAFGPLNVVLSQMSVDNDRGNYEEVMTRAVDVHLPADYAPTRAAHFWFDKARAQTWTARHDDAVYSLYEARKVAPQLTRYHPGVHETVATLLRARQRASDPLRDFAQWSGI